MISISTCARAAAMKSAGARVSREGLKFDGVLPEARELSAAFAASLAQSQSLSKCQIIGKLRQFAVAAERHRKFTKKEGFSASERKEWTGAPFFQALAASSEATPCRVLELETQPQSPVESADHGASFSAPAAASFFGLLSARDLADLAWSIAILKRVSGTLDPHSEALLPPLWRQLGETYVAHPNDASRLLWAISQLITSGQASATSCAADMNSTAAFASATATTVADREKKTTSANAVLVTTVADRVLRAVLESAGIQKFSAGEQASFLHSCAKMRLPACGSLLQQLELGKVMRQDPLDCSACLHALVELREQNVVPRLPTSRMAEIFEAVRSGLLVHWAKVLRTREYAQITFSLAKLRRGDDGGTLCGELGQLLAAKFESFPSGACGGLDVANIAWGLARLGGYPTGKGLSLMHESLRAHVPAADERERSRSREHHVAGGEHEVGVFQRGPGTRPPAHFQHSKQRRSTMATTTLRDISCVLYAHGIFANNGAGLEDLKPSAARFAELLVRHPDFLLNGEGTDQFGLDAQSQAVTVYTLAKLFGSSAGSELSTEVRQQLVERVFARVGAPSAGINGAWNKKCDEGNHFTWQGLHMLAWSAVTMQRLDDCGWWSRLATDVVGRAAVAPQDNAVEAQHTKQRPIASSAATLEQSWANLLWAFGTFAGHHEAHPVEMPFLFEAFGRLTRELRVGKQATVSARPEKRIAADWCPLDGMHIVWACSKMKLCCPEVLAACLSPRVIRPASLSISETATLIHSCAALNMNPAAEGMFTSEPESESSQSRNKSSGSVLRAVRHFCGDAQAVRALADCDGSSSCAAGVRLHPSDFPGSCAVLLLWSAAVLDDKASAKRLLPYVVGTTAPGASSAGVAPPRTFESWTQRAAQAAVAWLRLAVQQEESQGSVSPGDRSGGTGKDALGEGLRGPLLAGRYERQFAAPPVFPQTSKLQKDVTLALAKVLPHRFRVEEEYQHPDLPWSRLDVAVPSLKLAIEINGPGHYLLDAQFDTDCHSKGETGTSSCSWASLRRHAMRSRWNAREADLPLKSVTAGGEATAENTPGGGYPYGDARVALKRSTGASAFRVRVLQKYLGWQVVEIPFLEWDAAQRKQAAENGTGTTATEIYLRAKIRRVMAKGLDEKMMLSDTSTAGRAPAMNT
eukprot:g11388.t1